jgi:hypothetical protein
MFRLLEAIFKLNIKECIYVYTYVYVYIYIHIHAHSCAQPEDVSESRNTSLQFLKKEN